MSDLSIVLQGCLALVLVLLAVLSLQLVTLIGLRLFRAPRALRVPDLPDEALPRVLVQLPVCDEGGLAVRVAAAAARLDWPKDRLEIQVLDDGPTYKHGAVVEAVKNAVPAGVTVNVLHRGERVGFKAGNLAHGLKHSNAPYVAIFDADFVPPPDFLRRMVPALVADEGLAFVQARWGHANRFANWLTRVQGVLLDSHFAVEQEARFRAGLPMSFNGTAGVWNRAAIESCGGWTGDTLTEDLDLSLRCTLKGWRSAMVSDLEVPGELPETAAAWRAQQARWTKGHAQVARKLLPVIWSSNRSVVERIAMTLQMCQFAFYTLAGLSVTISVSLMAMGVVPDAAVGELGMAVTVLGLSASLGYLYTGQKLLRRSEEPALARVLLLGIVFPSGLVLANARATYEAFSGSGMNFVRTAKAGTVQAGGWRGSAELATGVLLPVFALAEQVWSVPFFTLAAAGLLSIGGMGWNSRVPARERIANSNET